MKPKDKILTYEQARELKWFCRNVVGTRQEFYALMERMEGFREKLDRMHETCELIQEHLGEEIRGLESPDWNRHEQA